MLGSTAWRELLTANGLSPGEDRRERPLGVVGAVLIYAGVYLRDILSLWLPPAIPLLVLALGVSFSIAAMALKGLEVRTGKILGKWLVFAVVLAWTVGSALTQTINTSSYYIAPLLGFLLIN